MKEGQDAGLLHGRASGELKTKSKAGGSRAERGRSRPVSPPEHLVRRFHEAASRTGTSGIARRYHELGAALERIRPDSTAVNSAIVAVRSSAKGPGRAQSGILLQQGGEASEAKLGPKYPGPTLTVATENVLRVTGLSNHQLASLVGTTQPTIVSILRGRKPARADGLLGAVLEIQSVVQRILRLANNNQSTVKLALYATDSDEVSVLEHLKERKYARAYLVALDFINQLQGIVRPARHLRRKPSLETVILRDADNG